MRRRLPFLAPTVVTVVLMAALVSGADRRAEAAFPVTTRTPSLPTKQQAVAAYAKLPLSFAPNAGQHDRRVLYAAQAGNASFFLTRREAVVALGKGRRGLALRLAFLGASPEAAIAGADRSPGRVNYLVGNDPAHWQTNLPTYEEVVYRNLWPGIDMAVRGGRLKYEFRIAPGGDPAQIRLAYRGQERLSLDQGGALRIQTALGVLRDARPVSYQRIDGERVVVASRFALGHFGSYGFALGAYDRRHPLVIDPGLVYSTYLGGNGTDFGLDIAVDGAGSAYLTGVTDSPNFPTSTGAFDRRLGGRKLADAFIVKLTAAGSALGYSTYLGGSGNDAGTGIAVDDAGSAYVVGSTRSTNFPTSAGAFDRSYNSRGDAFVTKLNAVGSGLVYSTYVGGSRSDSGNGIAVDPAGSAYVTGASLSTDFPTTAGAFDTSYKGNGDAFVTKLNAAGSILEYSTYVGGSGGRGAGRDYSSGIAVDGAGSAYVTGSTNSRNFPTSAAAFDTSYNGEFDAFVTKLNAAGSSLAYSTYLGGSHGDGGYGIAVDTAGSGYVTGSTDSANFPTTAGAFDRSSDDAFVTKLNGTGSALAYSTYLGGGRFSIGLGYGVAVDGSGRAYVTGYTDSRSFPTTAGAFDRSFNGGDFDAFVTRLNAASSGVGYSTYLGGSRDEDLLMIAVDAAGSAYVVGATDSRTFPTTAGAFDRRYNGGKYGDAFVTKLDLVAGPVRCYVPLVIGMRLAKAKRTIRAWDCSVGRVSRVRSRRVGRVLRQRPRAGAVRRRCFPVRLVVGRG